LIKGRWYTAVDLVFSLVWPAVTCLVLPVAIVLSWIVAVYNVATMDLPVATWIAVFGIGYVLAFSTSSVMALNYRSRSRDISLKQTIVLIHSIGLFQFVWGVAGWRALGRVVQRQGSWAKTERVVPLPGLPS
jgi:hypothetical protein